MDHETCTVDGCDCTCAGCRPSQCNNCPKCGAEVDGAPDDGGVTDPGESSSYYSRRTAA